MKASGKQKSCKECTGYYFAISDKMLQFHVNILLLAFVIILLRLQLQFQPKMRKKIQRKPEMRNRNAYIDYPIICTLRCCYCIAWKLCYSAEFLLLSDICCKSLLADSLLLVELSDDVIVFDCSLIFPVEELLESSSMID